MHLLVSSHPRILISLCLCVFACVLSSLHPHIFRFICPFLHPCILISSGSCVFACILASSHPDIFRFICVNLYPCIRTSSYPQVHVRLLVSSHPHILISSGLCVLASMLTPSGQRVLNTNETQFISDTIYKCFVYLMFNILFIFIIY